MADWQQAIALIITALAAIYLVRRLRSKESASGAPVGGCHGCGKRRGMNSENPVPLVQLESPVSRKKDPPSETH
jgi:hypothetical protein